MKKEILDYLIQHQEYMVSVCETDFLITGSDQVARKIYKKRDDRLKFHKEVIEELKKLEVTNE